jgi:cleavage and polyadenylation specificity factor subunit 2
MLEITYLSAAESHLCLLLTLDTLTILIDASTEDGKVPVNLPSQLDFILLTHSTESHLNKAFPRIVLTHPNTQVYSTLPVSTLGRLSLQEQTPNAPTVGSVKSEDEYEYLSLKDIDNAFDKITTLRYSQPTILSHGITITAYPAGHSIGGTIWNIRKDQENIVIMLDWNHAKERIIGGHLDSKTLRLLDRASCLITDVRGCSQTIPTRKIREQCFVGKSSLDSSDTDSVTNALNSGKSVFIPAPPPTRSLELLTLIDSTKQLHNYPIFYLGKTTQKAISQTRTMLEWLSQDITSDSPLSLSSINLVHDYAELSSGKPGPRLVIVDDVNLHPRSFSHQTFLDFKQTGNLMLYPSSRVSPSSISAVLLEHASMIPSTFVKTLTIPHVDRIPLQPDELATYKRTKSLAAEKISAELFQKQYDSQDELSSEDESDSEVSVKPVVTVGYDFWAGETKRLFPFFERRARRDEFGMEVRVEEYSHIEDAKPVVRTVELGRKRKWGETETEEVPEREVRSEMTDEVNVLVEYVDLEGLHDGRAVGNLLPRCNPRKIVRTWLLCADEGYCWVE